MDNPEFIELRNRFFFGLFICLIIVVCFIFLFVNKFNDGKSNIIKKIYKDESFLLYIYDSKTCKNCLDIENKLYDLNTSYFKYDISKNKDYLELCNKLNINPNKDISPSLIYINNGDVLSSCYNIEVDDVSSFIEFLYK